MSQPLQYSNLLFDVDPNGLAAELVNKDAKQARPSQGSGRNSSQYWTSVPTPAKRHHSEREPPKFESFDTQPNESVQYASSQNRDVNPVSYTPGVSNSQSGRILSRSWDQIQVGTQMSQRSAPSNALSSSQLEVKGSLATPAMAMTSKAVHQSPVVQNVSQLLSQQILPASSKGYANNMRLEVQGAVTNTASKIGQLQSSQIQQHEARIPASHAPTFRPPRQVTLPTFFEAESSLSKSNEKSQEAPEAGPPTSLVFNGPEIIMSRNRIVPGPAMDAWLTMLDGDTQGDYSQRDTNQRVDRNPDDKIRMGNRALFLKGPWLSFCHTYEQPAIFDATPVNQESLIHKYNCHEILRKGLGSNAQKIPFLALVVVRIRFHEHYATARMADPTGEIESEFHEDVLRNPAWVVQEGSVLVLRRLTVCRPLFVSEEVSTHTLIITPTNVEQVYPPDLPVPSAFASLITRTEPITSQHIEHSRKNTSVLSKADVSKVQENKPKLLSSMPKPSQVVMKKRKPDSPEWILDDDDEESSFDEDFDDAPFVVQKSHATDARSQSSTSIDLQSDDKSTASMTISGSTTAHHLLPKHADYVSTHQGNQKGFSQDSISVDHVKGTTTEHRQEHQKSNSSMVVESVNTSEPRCVENLCQQQSRSQTGTIMDITSQQMQHSACDDISWLDE